jgi:hypothetical protein
MTLTAETLLKKTDKERSGDILTIDHGSSFWRYREKGVKPCAYLSKDEITNFAGRNSENDMLALNEAVRYWEDKAEQSAFSFLKLKDSGEHCFVNLVAVVHGVDDDAPWDASHKMFVPTDSTGRVVTSEYVKLANASNPSQKRIDKAKPNRVPGPSDTLEVWIDDGYQTKKAGEMETFILQTDPQRGKSNVKRCVSALSRGGKFTVKYGNDLTMDVLHASKGKRGDSGTCSVFYVEYLNKVRLIAIGYHTGNASYAITWSEPTLLKGKPSETPVLRSSVKLD